MRTHHLALVVSAALAASGCFQSTTLIKVNGDGSGTIEQTTLMTSAAIAQLKQLATLGGENTKPFDPLGEDELRQAAAKIGPSVKFVSSAPIKTSDGEGRTAIYSFTDISEIRLNEQPSAPGGAMPDPTGQPAGKTSEPFRFSMEKRPNGNAVLHILSPEPKKPAAAPPAEMKPPMGAQLALMKQFLAGMRIAIAVQPAGRLVKTTSKYVDGQKVTLIDVQFDQLLKDEALLARLEQVKDIDDMKTVLKDVPGLKVNLDRDTTIEFTPAK